MGLIKETAYQYYTSKQEFVAAFNQKDFVLTFKNLPESKDEFKVYVNSLEVSASTYSYDYPILKMNSGMPLDTVVEVELIKKNTGDYRFISLKDIVNNFMIAYVGDGKIIDNVHRSEALFHCKRGIQEFAYDVSRVEKILEVELPMSLSIPMPQDYVNYVRISWVDSSGIEHPIYPSRLTSRPSQSIVQSSDYEYVFSNDGGLVESEPITNSAFNAFDIDNLSNSFQQEDSYLNRDYNNSRAMTIGQRYGLNPETANINGVFIIDEANGKISFSSDLSGKVITLKYISDGLGTDSEMKVHKFLEEAMYKHMAHAILSNKLNVQEYIVGRFKKERRAAISNAKIRLSNLKVAELTQVLRGAGKPIK